MKKSERSWQVVGVGWVTVLKLNRSCSLEGNAVFIHIQVQRIQTVLPPDCVFTQTMTFPVVQKQTE